MPAADFAGANGDDRVAGAELARDALVLLAQRHDALDAVDGLQRQSSNDRAVADRADDGALSAGIHVHAGASALNQGDDVLHLLRGGGGAHDDDELGGSGGGCCTHRAEGYRGSGFQPPLAAACSASSSCGLSARQVPTPSRPSVSGP